VTIDSVTSFRLMHCDLLGKSAQAAAEISMKLLSDRVGGEGGCIAIDRSCSVGVSFNVEGMAWSLCQDGVLRRGIYRNELVTEPV